MKAIKTMLFFVLLTIILINISTAQNTVIIGDTIEIGIEGYKAGNIQWQFSKDKIKWENLANANTEILIYKISETGLFRAKVDNGSCSFFSEENFIYVAPIEKPIQITDEGANLKIQWNFNISPLLVSRYIVTIEDKDTTIEVTGKNNEFLLPRKMEYYNKTFSIKSFTSWGVELPKQTIKYENNYAKFFTCKNKYVAHRGLSIDYPENTKIAFEKAADAGFEYVECDIWLTKDHQWVVIHDETIDRTSDGIGKVSQYTFDELQKFNFGNPKIFGNKYYQKIQSIFDFLYLCKIKKLRPLIEIKQEKTDEQDFINLIKITTEMLPIEQFAFHSFGIPTLTTIRRLNENIILGFITVDSKSEHLNVLNNLYPSFYNVSSTQINYNFSLTNQVNNKIFHLFEKGFNVSLWTINNRTQLEYLSKSIFFILTDITPSI